MQQFIEQFTVPAASPYTYDVENPTGATLVQVQSAAGVPVSGCTLVGGVLTVPSTEADAVLWVIYNATPATSYAGSKAQTSVGLTLGIGTTANGTVTPIGELATAPAGLLGKYATTEVTNSQSLQMSTPADEHIKTYLKRGPVTIKGNRVSSDAGQAMCIAATASDSVYYLTFQFPKNASQVSSGDKYVVPVLVNSYDWDQIDWRNPKEIGFEMEVQPSGVPQFTAGA